MSFLIYPREDWVTNGSGKNGDNRGGWQSSKRRKRNNKQKQSKGGPSSDTQSQKQENYSTRSERSGINARFDRNRGVLYERPKWVPPKVSTEPLPQPDCPWCGKPVKDIAIAVQDKETGAAVHFDCILASLCQGETLEKGDAITYIGGGRFGVVHFGSPQSPKKFFIKKIFEWEDKDNRAGWRGIVSDHYSVT